MLGAVGNVGRLGREAALCKDGAANTTIATAAASAMSTLQWLAQKPQRLVKVHVHVGITARRVDAVGSALAGERAALDAVAGSWAGARD